MKEEGGPIFVALHDSNVPRAVNHAGRARSDVTCFKEILFLRQVWCCSHVAEVFWFVISSCLLDIEFKIGR